MWRVIAYSLGAFAGSEALLLALFREAYVWLGIQPADLCAVPVVLVVGGFALVVGGVSGAEAAEAAERASEAAARRAEHSEERRLAAERDKIMRLEALVGPEPGTVQPSPERT